MRFKQKCTLFCALVLLAAAPNCFAQLRGQKGLLTVTFLDVGQGDSTVLQTPQGKFYIVDAGPSDLFFGGNTDAGGEVVVPFVQAQQADAVAAVLVTHAHLDHYGGFFTVLDRVPVLEWIDSGLLTESKLYLHLLSKVKSLGIARRQVQAGDLLDWDEKIQTEVLWPPSTALNFDKKGFINNHSIVLMVQYKKISFLLTGDIEEAAEQALMKDVLKHRRYLKATVLKMPHHGSKTSATQNFLSATQPQLIVISCGKNNKFGHPHEIVIQRMRELGLAWKQTNQEGSVQVVTDGENYEVYTSTMGFMRP